MGSARSTASFDLAATWPSTPNARLTRLHQAELHRPRSRVRVHPSGDGRSSKRLAFEIVEAKGLNYWGASRGGGGFLGGEVATRRGVLAQIEDCYLLAYLCKKPD